MSTVTQRSREITAMILLGSFVMLSSSAHAQLEESLDRYTGKTLQALSGRWCRRLAAISIAAGITLLN